MPHTVDDDDFACEAREDGRGGDAVADDDTGGGAPFEPRPVKLSWREREDVERVPVAQP